jgi:hypothetical protein
MAKRKTRAAMANVDPKSNFLGRVAKAGYDPFGSTDYNDWLQNDAFATVDSLYGMAIQKNPKLTRQKFNNRFFRSEAGNSFISPGGFAVQNAQANPRDYYNMQAQNAGVDLAGVSPYEKFMREEGYNQTVDAYGAASQRDPQLNFFQYL